jgi:hypothetical protein
MKIVSHRQAAATRIQNIFVPPNFYVSHRYFTVTLKMSLTEISVSFFGTATMKNTTAMIKLELVAQLMYFFFNLTTDN